MKKIIFAILIAAVMAGFSPISNASASETSGTHLLRAGNKISAHQAKVKKAAKKHKKHHKKKHGKKAKA
jgi:Ni/Co efflux regulator RcnB